MSSVHVGSWELVIGDDRLTWSDDARRVIGLETPARDASPEALFALAHHEDVESLRSAFASGVRDGSALDIECRIARSDGTMRRIHLLGVHIAADATHPARLWGTMHDVTDRPRISNLVRASDIARADADEARAEAGRILEIVSDAFVALDREWRYTHVNRKAASIFGRTPGDLIGKHIWTEFPDGIGQPFYHAYHKAMTEREFAFLEEYYPPYDRWFENRIHPTPEGIAIFFHDISDRKRAEQVRREWEERFRQLADNIEEVFWLSTVETGAFIYVSPAFETIWGRPCADIYRAPQLWWDAIHPDDRPGVRTAAERQATGGYDEEYRILRPDGTIRWIADRAFPIRDEHGVVYRIAGVAQDITERHAAAEVIQRIASGLTTTLESITDAFYTLDRDGQFTYVNHEAERLMEQPRSALLGQSVWSVFPEAVNTEFHRQFVHAMRNNVVVKFEEYYPPLLRWFEVRAYPSAQGLAVYFLDVTERRRVLDVLREREETLRQRTDQLDAALEAAQLGVWSWDLASNLVTTIQGSGPATGLPEGTYPSTGEAFTALVHPDDRVWVTNRLRVASATGTDYQAEFRVRAPDGSTRWISSQGHWTRDAEGAPRVMIGADLDITARRQAAQELRAFAQRLDSAQDAERATIAREVHDDLGQALTVLRMDSSRLARMSTSNPELSALVGEMTELIDSTLQKTRSIATALHPSALEDLGLAAAIEIHVTHVARRASLSATLELVPVSARVDRERARAAYRVMQESLTNVVRHADATQVVIRLDEHDAELVLEVTDDGCGIRPDQLSGTGSLGLIGMRERAAAFDGTVHIAAQEPCGTAVTLRLPLGPRAVHSDA